MVPENRMTLQVVARDNLTKDICQFTLARPEGGSLPAFTPGAHITVETPGGAMRRYSLVNDGGHPTLMSSRSRESRTRGAALPRCMTMRRLARR